MLNYNFAIFGFRFFAFSFIDPPVNLVRRRRGLLALPAKQRQIAGKKFSPPLTEHWLSLYCSQVDWPLWRSSCPVQGRISLHIRYGMTGIGLDLPHGPVLLTKNYNRKSRRSHDRLLPTRLLALLSPASQGTLIQHCIHSNVQENIRVPSMPQKSRECSRNRSWGTWEKGTLMESMFWQKTPRDWTSSLLVREMVS